MTVRDELPRNPRDAGIVPGATYRTVFIVDERGARPQDAYDPSRDLVLTFDFALFREIRNRGGAAQYVDHLCESDAMQADNFRVYEFFRDWHRDAEGNDIFRFRGVDFGIAFRIEIWNDYTFAVRIRLCLERLRALTYDRLEVCSTHEMIFEALEDAGLAFTRVDPVAAGTEPSYYFPIYRWMDERLRIRRWRHVVRDVAIAVQGLAMDGLDGVVERFRPRKRVFVQEYHPTRVLLQRLLDEPEVRVVQGHFSSAPGLARLWRERPIPVFGRVGAYRAEADRLIRAFHRRRAAQLRLSGGVDATGIAYRAIERRIVEVLPRMLRGLDCVVRYLDRHPLDLDILIGNIGQLAMLVDCAAKSRGVPSFLVINGLLSCDYLDDAKYATVINAYSPTVRDFYFKGMDNIVCLGDPRMDAYPPTARRTLDGRRPTVVIGASGFNNVDLNSYLAVEFEFLADTLAAVERFAAQAEVPRVVVKVRPNGYAEQYRRFVAEYHPQLDIEIVDAVPMIEVLRFADVFVSIYSQTLFEASCLGVPVIYHKTDVEHLHPPFDEASELVTTRTSAELADALGAAFAGSERFAPFLDRAVMEAYVGPLDGGNLERNLDYVRGLLRMRSEEGER